MAQSRKGGERFTAFTFTENGRTLTRRIHRMEIQSNDGHLYVMEGDDLPDKLVVNTGIGHRGEHLATILLNRRNFPPPPKGKMKSWPQHRDVFHLLLGLTFSGLLIRVITLAESVR